MSTYHKINEQGEYPIDGNECAKLNQNADEFSIADTPTGGQAPRWRDVGFVVLFWLNVIAWLAVTVASRGRTPHEPFGDTHTLTAYLIPGVIMCAVAAAFAALCMTLALRYPIPYGYCAIVMQIIYTIGLVVYICVQGVPDPVFIIFGVLYVLILLWTLYHFYRFKEFFEQLVGVCRDVGNTQRGIYVTSAVGILCHMGWMCIWGYAIITTLPMWEGAAMYGVGIHSLFTFYWIAEALRNMVHTTVAGSLASWYFAGETYRPENPTLGAFRRATTYSFGSICFGSLLVAILTTIRRLLQVLQHAKGRNGIIAVLAIIARLVLVLVEAVLRFFNKYIFTIVAIYGDSYVTAAKKTLKLFGKHGFEMVMNNNICVSIIGATTIVGAYSVALLGYFLADTFQLPALSLALVGAVLGVFIVEGSFALMESGSMSIMVCYFLHREKMQMARPELYRQLSAAESRIMAAAQ